MRDSCTRTFIGRDFAPFGTGPLSAFADRASVKMLRELLTQSVFDTRMRKIIFSAAVSVATIGVALAQVEASSSTYLLDVDTARYAGPARQRLEVQVGDQPRHVALSAEDEICVQLQRAESDASVISAHVRVLRPQPHEVAVVRLAGPDISPGTYRSTPWGMLLRVLPEKSASSALVKPVGTANAPVCSL